ncbi:hypothetical protein WK46_25350 [Burkholderia ubonensis]|nr:hypothetical protein WK46_25350 [Burkholderia ubonensis]
MPTSDTVSMMALQKGKILTQRSPLGEDRADHPIGLTILLSANAVRRSRFRFVRCVRVAVTRRVSA